MKRVFKIIALTLLCVIGVFGLGIGGMYLFGGFDEKIVYADNLSFSEAEKISAETIYMQINTTTEGVTRNKVKLVASSGGNRIINFPEEAIIGQPFVITPIRDENGKNVGGNVTLTAYYDAVDANLNAVAQCNILIDIPVEEVNVKMDSLVLRPGGELTTLWLQDNELSSALDIAPLNSLTPYLISGSQSINNITNKKIFLELCYKDGTALSDNNTIAHFKVNNSSEEKKASIEVGYEVKDINSDGKKEVVFSDSVYIVSGNEAEDVILKAYTYATYKQQENNTVKDEDGNVVSVPLVKNQTLQNQMGFSIGSAEAIDIIFNSGNKGVYLNEEIRIFLNTEEKNMGPNDINLGLELVSDSPNSPIGNFRLLENIHIDVDKMSYRTLKNGSEKDDDEIYTSEGLKLKFDGITTQKDEWYWLFKINSFDAYYNYMNNEETFVATITYKEKENSIVKTFNIIPKAYEVDNISTKYEEGTSALKAQSGNALVFGDDNIVFNTSSLPQGVEPTFKELEHYISYDKNYDNGSTTVNTTPVQVGKYKATFNFYITKDTTSFSITPYSGDWATFEKVVFYQGNKTYTINYNSGVPQNPIITPAGATFNDYETPVQAEVILQIKSSTTSKSLFYINTEEEIGITNTMVKFYESISGEEGTETVFSTTPFLTINKIRFYVDFDYYKDSKTDIQYLRINDKTANSDFMKVQGIGTFYITTQLVYIDENTKQVYWLGKYVDTKIDVIEVLSNLSAYYYNTENNKYNDVFGTETISYKEGSVETEADYYYIFITSSTMESLKNYVIYNKINIKVSQNFANIAVENYPGIDSINANAIEFVSNWIEVIENDKVVGYRIAYKINPISTISVDGTTMLANMFNISISVDVDEETTVFAKFILDASTGYNNPSSLDVLIEDKTIQNAKIAYGTTENSQSKPLEAKAYVQNQEILWYDINFEENLKYFFGYDADATEGTTESMTYDINVIDSSKVVLTNLYSFSVNKTGKGGLILNNFPLNLNESGVNQGVLLKLTVYSLGTHDFNSHYAWNSSLLNFVQTQNSNLSADLYIKVFGLEINIEANNPEVFGIKDEQSEIENGTAGVPFIGENGVFKVTAKSGKGSEINVDNYTNVMSVFINNENLYLDETSKTLYFKNDFLIDKNVQFIFYVGSNANRIRIKTGEDGQTNIYQTYYEQLIKSAYDIEITKDFTAPSVDQTFATILYNGAPEVEEGEENTFDINTLLTISVNVISTTLSNDYGIDVPITVNDQTNLLTFKTVPVKYNAVVRLSLTKKDGSNESNFKDYTINISPIYSEEDLTIGTLYEDAENSKNNYYYINAGIENLVSTVDGGIDYNNELDNTKANITNVDIYFADIASDKVNVDAHMGKIVKTNELQIWSYDLNYSKTIEVKLIFNYKDGGKFIYVKNLTILPNLSLEFKNNKVNSNVTSINLTNTNSYVFTKNGLEIDLEMPDFVYDDLNTNYNYNSFNYDSTVLSDISSTTSDDQDFLLKPLINSLQISGVVEKTIISFNYVSDRGYILTFDLPLYIQYLSSGDYVLKVKQTDFNCSTTNQQIFGLFYKDEGGVETELSLEQYADVMDIKLKEVIVSIPDKYSVENPITFDSNNCSFTFKTLSVDYSAKVYMELTPLIGNSKAIVQEFIINVSTIYNQEDLIVGNLYVDESNSDNNYYFIEEGVDNLISSENEKIKFNNNLDTNKLNIKNVEIAFENYKLNPEDEEDKQNPNDYMEYSYENKILKIWCKGIAENKNIKINITLNFVDGGKLVFENFVLRIINK